LVILKRKDNKKMKIIKKFLTISLLLIISIISYIVKIIYQFLKENKSNIKKYYKSLKSVLKEELAK